MPKYARVDDTQKVIVAALRDAGAMVQSLATIGGGCADLLIAFRNQWIVAEIKSGKETHHQKHELNENEREWHAAFGTHAPVHIWHTIDEALKGIGAT